MTVVNNGRKQQWIPGQGHLSVGMATCPVPLCESAVRFLQAF